MKREARLLLKKAVDSLILSTELFNRPWDRGRVDAVLILLDHSFEMFLKAAVLHKGGQISEPRATQTLGFDARADFTCLPCTIRYQKEREQRRHGNSTGWTANIARPAGISRL